MSHSSKIRSTYDAVVVGSGPNGLAAAITIAQTGRSVLILEAKETIGGGTRTSELTLPGFQHDVCSSIHTVGVSSPFFLSLPLKQYGLEWIFSTAEAVHPLDGGQAVLLYRSVSETARAFGQDSQAYLRLFNPLVKNYPKIAQDLLGPLPLPPRHPLAMAQFGIHAIQSAASLAKRIFRTRQAQALFAGFGGHSIQPLETFSTAGVAITLQTSAHASGMPLASGGSQSIADALGKHFLNLGGQIETGFYVESLEQLPRAGAYLLDVSPRQLIKICADRLPGGYQRRLKNYRYGPGVFKLDYALDGPIPWQSADCLKSATVHIGGTLDEIAQAERDVWQGVHPEKPYVILTQTSLFDSRRAPPGKHTVWAYCHVPANSSFDMTGRIEAQIERFAPGFNARILARHSLNAVQMEAYNPNYIGGDIIGGVQDLRQLYFRPTISLDPYKTPLKGVYLCSASTPPGGAVHGMCGYYAARSALRNEF